MNPIELCWSKLKAALKDFGARTVDDLHQAIRRAMDLICAVTDVMKRPAPVASEVT
jgi:transposase